MDRSVWTMRRWPVTASSGSDFQDASGTLNWDDGDTSGRVITINLIDDAEVEGDESFSLTLSAPTGGAVLAANEAFTEIVSDDIDSGDGDGDGDGDGGGGGGGGGAFGSWSLVFLYGFVFAGNVRRRRTPPGVPLTQLASKCGHPRDPFELDSGPELGVSARGRFAAQAQAAALTLLGQNDAWLAVQLLLTS